MAAISVAAEMRHGAPARALKALDMDGVLIPSTKANPIDTEAFYAEILAEIAGRVVALEATLRVANKRNARRIDDLEEAMATLLNRSEALEASVPGEAPSEAADKPADDE